jgi:hypothetical protein
VATQGVPLQGKYTGDSYFRDQFLSSTTATAA